jgi:hypothetical protein
VDLKRGIVRRVTVTGGLCKRRNCKEEEWQEEELLEEE